MADYIAGTVINRKFATVDADDVPTTLAGSPVVSIYKDNSTTQDTDGVTLTVDFDGVTGLHNLRIDTSADPTFYSAASEFDAIITAGTVDGVSMVGFPLFRFSIEKEAATLLAGNGTYGLSALETRLDAVDAMLVTIESQTDDIGAAGAGLTALGDARLANLDATVSSRLASASITLSGGAVTVGTNNDKTNYTLTAAQRGLIADDVWDEARAGHVASGSFGEVLDATISSRLATSGYTAPLDAAGIRAAVGLAAANLDTQVAALSTAIAAIETALPADPADASDIAASFASIATTLGNLATAANLAALRVVADAVQAKTDQLTFTKANELDVNLQSINGVALIGTGAAGNEFEV